MGDSLIVALCVIYPHGGNGLVFCVYSHDTLRTILALALLPFNEENSIEPYVTSGDMVQRDYRQADVMGYNKTMDTERLIVYLEITSWRGMSIGAIHWYGKLVCTRPYQTVSLKHKLTQKQADALNDYRNREFPGDKHQYQYRAGFETNGFDDEASIKRLAKRTYKKYFPDAKILLLGNSVYREVKLVLDCESKLFAQLSKKAYDTCEKLGWYDKGKDDAVDKIYAAWEKSLKELLSR